jgi:Catalytic LigB subunit of aromatic ring-opening dioxygenase
MMAEIVLGIGTSHGPMLSTPPEGWDLRVPDDRRNIHHFRSRTWTFEELVNERRGEHFENQITLEVWKRRHAACRAALAHLANLFEETRPDVAILFGDDQMECFKDTMVPAFGVFYGDSFVNSEYSPEHLARLPPGIAPSVPGHIPPGGATYPGVPQLGRHLIERLIADGFDITAMPRVPGNLTPHAFGFLYRQIMRDAVIPSVPVFVNTFYPPNQPPAIRCAELGRAIASAVQEWPSSARVALIASGGLSHFVIDEALDDLVLQGLRNGDLTSITALAESVFQSGTSEIKNWIPLAAAMIELDIPAHIVDYVPCYRSLAGTGNAMGFAYWRK